MKSNSTIRIGQIVPSSNVTMEIELQSPIGAGTVVTAELPLR